jgi:probable O-glycosylation ligase (exosortase A-associated)
MKGLILVYLMTYGGAVAAIFDPFVGLLIYVAFAVLRPESVWPWAVPPGNYSRIVAIGLLAGWALNGFGRWDLERGKAVILALIGFFVWTIASASQAPDQGLAWEYIEKYAKIILPILVGITIIDSVRRLKLLAWVILLSQAYPAFELNQAYFGGYNLLREEGFGGMDNNFYACSLVTCTGLAGFLAWHSERWWQQALAAVSGAFMVHAILFSFSRGGMLGLIVVGVSAFAIMPKRPREWLAFLSAVVLGLAFAGPQVGERFSSAFVDKGERDTSAQSRIDLWAACWDTMQKNPVFGVGPDHMPLVTHQYGFYRGKETHTLWLNTGAELGIPALLLLVSYYGTCLIRLVPIARGKTPVFDPWLTYLARMVVASLSGFVVSAQFVNVDFLEPPYYIALLGAGVLKCSPPLSRSGRGRSSLTSIVLLLAAGVLKFFPPPSRSGRGRS